jgi:hypothetical protein
MTPTDIDDTDTIRAENHRKVDVHINKLMTDYEAEHGWSIGLRLIDKVLRPYAKLIGDCHLDKVDPDEIAGMVEQMVAYMLTRLLRHTVPANDQVMAMEIAAAMMQNIADAVGTTIIGDFKAKPRIILDS